MTASPAAAPPCDGSASWLSLWSITKPTLHYLAPRDIDVAPVQGQLTEKNVKFFLPLPHFPRQISIFVSPSTRQRSCTTAVSACNQKAKEKRKPPCAWRIVLYLKRTAVQNVAFCVFFSCSFSRVGKNQWARVTRNKEKTRRGLIEVLQHCRWLTREQRAAQRGPCTHARESEPGKNFAQTKRLYSIWHAPSSLR